MASILNEQMKYFYAHLFIKEKSNANAFGFSSLSEEALSMSILCFLLVFKIKTAYHILDTHMVSFHHDHFHYDFVANQGVLISEYF